MRGSETAALAASCAAALLGAAPAVAQEDVFGGWPFIPVPEIDLDPYSGTTLGLIPTVLRTNGQSEIEKIIAPDIIHNQYFGWGSRLRVFGFPSADEQWMVVGGGKERVEREFDGRFASGQARTGLLSWSVEAIYDRSGTPRFFGLGNGSPLANQSTYLDNQASLDGRIGINFSPALQLAYLASARYVDVLPGVLPGVPSITTLFPAQPGVGAEHELQQRLIFTYDTRDSLLIPRSGQRLLIYTGAVTQALGSSVSYSFAGAEARGYCPLGRDVTLVWHASLRYMPSAREAPFWALSSLGGDISVPGEREPLRSDGADRYLDRNLSAAGAELRTRVASFDALGTRIELELAPFLDTGKVFTEPGTSPVSHLHHAVGLGVRGIARPHVVGYVDFGYGQGKSAVFSGIDYPF